MPHALLQLFESSKASTSLRMPVQICILIQQELRAKRNLWTTGDTMSQPCLAPDPLYPGKVISAVRPAAQVTVIVPTRNESGNVAELLRRVDAAVGERALEVIFVDDSDDETPATIESEGERARSEVRLLHRPAGQRDGGLGGAVLAGFRAASAPWAVVMDGDLQHPPEALPDLLAPTDEAGVDLVVASRYTGDGDASGLDGRWRASASALCTRLAKLIFARKLDGISDPMSGFFAVRLGALDLEQLHPQGYKILMEVIARSRLNATRDVTYSFQSRFSGESKASMRQGLLFLRQLVVLRALAVRAGLADHLRARSHPSATAFLGHVVRISLPVVFLAVAFPNLTQHSWRTVTGGSASPGVLAAMLIALALLAGRTRPGRHEPDVHDRQLDAILGLSFLASSVWLKLQWPASMDVYTAPPAHEVVAMVLFLFGASLLVLGTRATARLKWALLVPLLGVPQLAQHWRVVDAALLLLFIAAGLRATVLRRSRRDRRARSGAVRPHVWPRARYAAVVMCGLAVLLGSTTLATNASAADKPAPAAGAMP
jgi:glycosyltransferase involved in cell wall biosynthesis